MCTNRKVNDLLTMTAHRCAKGNNDCVAVEEHSLGIRQKESIFWVLLFAAENTIDTKEDPNSQNNM